MTCLKIHVYCTIRIIYYLYNTIINLVQRQFQNCSGLRIQRPNGNSHVKTFCKTFPGIIRRHEETTAQLNANTTLNWKYQQSGFFSSYSEQCVDNNWSVSPRIVHSSLWNLEAIFLSWMYEAAQDYKSGAFSSSLKQRSLGFITGPSCTHYWTHITHINKQLVGNDASLTCSPVPDCSYARMHLPIGSCV